MKIEDGAVAGDQSPTPVEIHVVCRANRGRSPVVAHLLREAASRGELDVAIHDSGLYASERHRPIHRLDALVETLGLDMAGRQPTLAAFTDPARIALVITFETALKHHLVQLEPELADRVFTQHELLRLASSPAWPGERGAWGDDHGQALVSSLHLARPLVDPGDDDTPDPVLIRSRRAMRRFLAQLRLDTEKTSEVLWGYSAGADFLGAGDPLGARKTLGAGVSLRAGDSLGASGSLDPGSLGSSGSSGSSGSGP